MSAKTIIVGAPPNEVMIGGAAPFVLIAGPCVLEGYDTAFEIAARLKVDARDLGIPFIFKASFDKANRTSHNSYRGVGVHKGREIFQRLRDALGIKILTDVHDEEGADIIHGSVDVIQIPAMLSRQTDLIQHVAMVTGKPINIKKGQSMAPSDMRYAIEKVGHERVMVTERGTSFGYHNLVVDFRSLGKMRELGHPVVFDVTHSLQLPGAGGHVSSGLPEFIFPMARAGVAFGVDAIFMEVHPRPEQAKCDGANSLALAEVPSLLKQLVSIEKALGSSL